MEPTDNAEVSKFDEMFSTGDIDQITATMSATMSLMGSTDGGSDDSVLEDVRSQVCTNTNVIFC